MPINSFAWESAGAREVAKNTTAPIRMQSSTTSHSAFSYPESCSPVPRCVHEFPPRKGAPLRYRPEILPLKALPPVNEICSMLLVSGLISRSETRAPPQNTLRSPRRATEYPVVHAVLLIINQHILDFLAPGAPSARTGRRFARADKQISGSATWSRYASFALAVRGNRQRVRNDRSGGRFLSYLTEQTAFRTRLAPITADEKQRFGVRPSMVAAGKFDGRTGLCRCQRQQPAHAASETSSQRVDTPFEYTRRRRQRKKENSFRLSPSPRDSRSAVRKVL